MDFILLQTDKVYKKALTQYQKALKQRNKLLGIINETGRGYDQIEYWTRQILLNGKIIQDARSRLLDNIDLAAKTNIKNLDAAKSTVVISYKHNLITEERLEKHKVHEVAAKTTLVGPHRDDFRIDYNGHELSEFGSRGQQRTVLLAIKLAEVDYFDTNTGERPVLLLDDIFSELDGHHKRMVLEYVDKQQTIITFAEKPSVISENGYSLINI